jgi:hypothetical protein
MKIDEIRALIDVLIKATNVISGERLFDRVKAGPIVAGYKTTKERIEGWISGNVIEGSPAEVSVCKATLRMFIDIVLGPTIAAFEKKLAQMDTIDEYRHLNSASTVACPAASSSASSAPQAPKIRKALIDWEAKHAQAESLLKKGTIWAEHRIWAQEKSLRAVSRANLEALRQQLGPLDKEELAFCQKLKKLPFTLIHSTSQIVLLESTDETLSSATVQQRHPHAKVNNDLVDEAVLGNHGYVFFRFGLQNEQVDSRFGITTLIFTPEELEFYEHGWISLHDMLAPLPSVNTQLFKIDGECVRRSFDENKGIEDENLLDSYRNTFSVQYGDIDLKNHIVHYYPGTKKWRKIHVTDEVFQGQDILEGIALSVLLEMRAMNATGEILERCIGKRSDPQYMTEILKNFARIEAKMPATVQLGGLFNVSVFHANYDVIRARAERGVPLEERSDEHKTAEEEKG